MLAKGCLSGGLLPLKKMKPFQYGFHLLKILI